MAITVSFSTLTRAQTIIEGGTARNNARTAGARAPGNMVTAGLVRAKDAVRDPFQSPQITETASSVPGPQAIFLAQAANILLDQLNRLFTFFSNLLLERAGLPPLFPTDASSTDGGDAAQGGDSQADTGASTDTGDGPDSTDSGGGRTGGRQPVRR
jgi:hypothetical protein